MEEEFTLTHENRNDNSSWPDWMHQAWNKTYNEMYSICPLDYPYATNNGSLRFKTLQGWQAVNFGDSILHKDGKLSLLIKDAKEEIKPTE